MSEPLYLIDGYGLIYRAYFAFIRRPLINSRGRNTSAVFGFLGMFLQLLRSRNPAYLAVALDSFAPTFRHERYKAYKATRQKTPEDLEAQIPLIEQVLEALGVPCIRAEGFEADDVMATLAEACRSSGRLCYLYSGDKDVLQLVGAGVRVLQPPKGGEGDLVEMDADQVKRERGVEPAQIIDYLALVGDSSDNVPGVPGVGEKTAVKLLEQFGSLDAIYARLAEIESVSQRRKLETGRDSAFLSRELVTLRRDAPVPGDVSAFELRARNPEKALELLHAEEIHAFDKELGGRIEAGHETLRRIRPGSYRTVITPDELQRWILRARDAGLYAVDTETDTLDELEARPIGISLAVAPGEACYIPLRARDVVCLDEAVVRDALAPLLADPALRLVGQNIKFDYKVLKRWGVEMARPWLDTMLAAFALDTTRNIYGLDRLARDLIGYQTIAYTDLIPKGESASLADRDIGSVTDYAAEDADIALQLAQVLEPRLREAGLEPLLAEVDMPNVKILGDMELAGIRLVPAVLQEFSAELESKLAQIERSIYAAVGREFNIGSTKQLQHVLFEERKLKPLKKTKTGFSTDADVLEELAREDEVCAAILEHRNLTKLKSTYVDTLPTLVNPRTGRLHTHYDQTGAATGRLASTDPNLQNIPVRDELGRRIRSAFVAEPGWSLLSADYSQIELVILAARSADELLTRAFREGRDVHTQTAALLFGAAESLVTPEMRRIGKTINFGVIYGMSAFRLSRETGIPRKDADAFIRTYFERFQGVARLVERSVSEAEDKGYVTTLRGRRRPVPAIRSANRTEKAGAERIAVNTPIQGSAADIVKMAMVAISHRLAEGGYRARLLLQVHDELVLEVPDDELPAVSALVRDAMEGVVDLGVPLRVGLKSGRSWGDIE